MFERITRIIEEKEFQNIQNANILLIGLGGVGGYALECLIRSGITKITICDHDKIERTNLNRQIIATQQTIGNWKADAAKKRALEINKNCEISIHKTKLTLENIDDLKLTQFDIILDACDDIIIKCALIKETETKKIPLISCLGTANRIHPELLTITTLAKTYNDPLAKRMRNILKKENPKLLKTHVIWSEEEPIKKKKLGTLCPVPMAAGSILASYALNKIKNKNSEN